MESEIGGDTPGADTGRYSGDEAREMLGDLHADGTRLADRIVTPPWYHPTLGGIVAVLVVAQALPGAYPAFLVLPALIGMTLLSLAYNRRYGVSFTRTVGTRTKRILVTMIAALVLAMIAAALIKLNQVAFWWALIPAGISCIATIALGRGYARALRHEVAAGPHA